MRYTEPWSPPRRRRPAPPRTVILTQRQGQMLSAACLGMSYADTAAKLFVSQNTVRTHTRWLYKAMGAHCRAQAVFLAMSGEVRVLVERGRYEVPEVAS